MNYTIENIEFNGDIDKLKDKLKEKLDITKDKIDAVSGMWNVVKKMIHNYEYIYTSYNSWKNVAAKRPISRSYFKLVEMIDEFNIDIDGEVLCLAEAPGGFIQRLNEMPQCSKIYGITLIKGNDVPHWNNSLLNQDNIIFLYGQKENGDIYDINNIHTIFKFV